MYETTPTTTDAAQIAASALLNALQRPAIDEPRIIELIAQHAPQAAPRQITITVADRPQITIDGQEHFKMELLLTVLAHGVNVMLVGEAGSGKTQAAENAAAILGLDFYPQSFGPTTGKSDIMGYMSPGNNGSQGVYVTSQLRRAFDPNGNGGLFCADEFDAASAAGTMYLNAALSNGCAGFPDGTIKKHRDFLVIACANTYGKGATAKFCGRNKLDAATLDRFAVIEWNIDEALEASMVEISETPETFDIAEGGTITPQQWLDTCRAARRAINAIGAELIVSPRAVKQGAALAASGVGRKHLLDMFIFKGADASTRAKISNQLPD